MNEIRDAYAASIQYDRRMYKHDIAGSTAHARMLAAQGIIERAEADAIVEGLGAIRGEIEDGTFPWRPELEDIHMNVERRLFDKIGETAGRLHTARSRNDQVALDVRMATKESISEVDEAIRDVQRSLLSGAESNLGVVMPGYTHLQRGQPVLLAHHMLAYFEMFDRDLERFRQAYARADVMPLGSGALAGVTYPIDREYVAKQLGFAKISLNSMDAIGDRDFLLDFESAAAICMMHLSRMSEELVLWSSEEFGFISLSDEYTTGSSIMPQKRNPDFAELARGKSGRVFGHLMGLLATMKGLPLTYNRDMQEDKQGFFDAGDTLLSTLRVFADMLPGMRVNSDRTREAAQGGYSLATDIADYLVAKGMSFREAHGVAARLSADAAEQGKRFDELALETYRRHSGLFDNDVYEITVESSIAARDVLGGTAQRQVLEALSAAKNRLDPRHAV